MKIVIRKSPPLFTFPTRDSGVGMLRRSAAMALALSALGTAFRCVQLLAADLDGADGLRTSTLADRWHIWLAGTLVAAVAARALWGRDQRPRYRE